jgi:hypothetical protein
MTEIKKPNTTFVTAVWGASYIERFCELSLPSFVSNGNIPSLAEATHCETIILTRESDFALFRRYPGFKRLESTCSVKFIDIEDLITDRIYGVTLTLAYTRALISYGRGMVDRFFIFMNADFILAEGSLRSILPHLFADTRVIMAPSFRSISEDLEEELRSAVDHESVLKIEPVEMARLALRNPHLTTVAKFIDQEVFCSIAPNQFFWKINDDAYLARYYLMFMLCLRPERVIESINGYCDYSFVPALCPSGPEVVVSDSDQFFMLELQARDSERNYISTDSKKRTINYIAQSLTEWTTAEHRRVAQHNVVFRAGPLPGNLSETNFLADEFISSIQKKLGPPCKAENHFYWVMGVEAWIERRRQFGIFELPSELAPYRLSTKAKLLTLRHRIANFIRFVIQAVRAPAADFLEIISLLAIQSRQAKADRSLGGAFFTSDFLRRFLDEQPGYIYCRHIQIALDCPKQLRWAFVSSTASDLPGIRLRIGSVLRNLRSGGSFYTLLNSCDLDMVDVGSAFAGKLRHVGAYQVLPSLSRAIKVMDRANDRLRSSLARERGKTARIVSVPIFTVSLGCVLGAQLCLQTFTLLWLIAMPTRALISFDQGKKSQMVLITGRCFIDG